MDVAVHAMAAADRGSRPGWGSTRSPVRAYGLRPDLFAVANVFAGEPDGGARAYAKGALEAISELCRLSSDRLAPIRNQAEELAAEGPVFLGSRGHRSSEPRK